MKTTTKKSSGRKAAGNSSTKPMSIVMEIARSFSDADYQHIAATALDRIKDSEYRKMAAKALKNVDYKQLAKDALKVIVPLVVMKAIYNRVAK